MPNPEPTHPKLLDGDAGLSPCANDDDVEGHLKPLDHSAGDEGGDDPEALYGRRQRRG
jgi:hypothetical protein